MSNIFPVHYILYLPWPHTTRTTILPVHINIIHVYSALFNLSSLSLIITLWYKVVQIWPGLFVCKQVTVCPGHIWTTLYIKFQEIVQTTNLIKEFSFIGINFIHFIKFSRADSRFKRFIKSDVSKINSTSTIHPSIHPTSLVSTSRALYV